VRDFDGRRYDHGRGSPTITKLNANENLKGFLFTFKNRTTSRRGTILISNTLIDFTLVEWKSRTEFHNTRAYQSLRSFLFTLTNPRRQVQPISRRDRQM
jgi:hypothetical protein